MFDFFRISRKAIKTPDIITYIQDIIFWLITGAVILVNVFLVSNGELRLYMTIITRPNGARFMDWNTSIKDYHYDENAQVHFVEFLEDASMENILMEAMIIAKVDKGTVRFTINGIPFNIDEDTALDTIINEAGIDLVDSCTYSDKIDKLIKDYNESLKKKEKHKQLVYVLDQIKNKKSTYMDFLF